MARLGVTYQDVANAANQIKGQGRHPTIELIRNFIGTGSTTTIANHLRQWRLEQNDATSIAIKENLPPEFIALMRGLWQRLLMDADTQVATAKQGFEQTNGALRQELEKYKANNQRWQKMYETWRKEKEILAHEKESLQRSLAVATQDHTTLVERLAAKDQQLHEKQARIDELQRMHKLAQENLEHFRESNRVERIREQEKHAQAMQQVERALKNTQLELNKSANTNLLLQKENISLNEAIAKVQSECEKYEHAQQLKDKEAENWRNQYESIVRKFDEMHLESIETQKENAVMIKQLASTREEIQNLKEQHKLLLDEKWRVAQEKANLEGQVKQMEKLSCREGS